MSSIGYAHLNNILKSNPLLNNITIDFIPKIPKEIRDRALSVIGKRKLIVFNYSLQGLGITEKDLQSSSEIKNMLKSIEFRVGICHLHTDNERWNNEYK